MAATIPLLAPVTSATWPRKRCALSMGVRSFVGWVADMTLAPSETLCTGEATCPATPE